MPNRWTYSVRFIPGTISRAQWRNTLMYRIDSDLQVGMEYNPLASDVRPLMNWRLLRENDGQPAIIVGTSSDRIGTPFGQSYYVTFSKTITDGVGLYVGVWYGEFDHRIRIPFGANFRFDDQWSGMIVHDGVNTHPMVSYSWDNYSVTFLLAFMRQPGFSFTIGF